MKCTEQPRLLQNPMSTVTLSPTRRSLMVLAACHALTYKIWLHDDSALGSHPCCQEGACGNEAMQELRDRSDRPILSNVWWPHAVNCNLGKFVPNLSAKTGSLTAVSGNGSTSLQDSGLERTSVHCLLGRVKELN